MFSSPTARDDRSMQVEGRPAVVEVAAEQWADGIPLFLAQLIKTLEIEQTNRPMRSRKVK
jgi:hypothetical protein